MSEKKMGNVPSTFFRDFLTGLTALAGLLALIFMLWRFGELNKSLFATYNFAVYVPEAGGVSDSSPVTLNGVSIGSVEAVAFDPSRGVKMTLGVREDISIPTNFTVYFDRSFVGQTSLRLGVPRGQDGKPAPSKDKVVANAEFDREAGDLFTTLQEMVQEPLAKLGKAADGIDTLAATYSSMGDKINDMIEPRTLSDVDAGAAPNIRSTIARVDRAISNADKWLADDTIRGDVREVVSRAKAFLDEAKATAESIKKTAESADAKIAELSAQGKRTLADASRTLEKTGDAAAEIGAVAASINKGEGTAGMLVKNPDLYRSLNETVQRLDQTLVELKLLIQKYKDEGLPIKF
ncbi:MAG: MCE family protein [Phycisphaerales bacterium]|nr:MCE family protein [Phycisphaerales bacterium]